MKPLIYLVIASLCITGCKKSSQSPKTTQTLKIVVSSVPQNSTYTVSLVDGTNLTASSPQVPFFTQSGSSDSTYTTSVYSGEVIYFNDVFSKNYTGCPSGCAIVTVSVNGATLLTVGAKENSGNHTFTIPSN